MSAKENKGVLLVTTEPLVRTVRSVLRDPSLVPCIFGPAGIGKSSITNQIAQLDFPSDAVLSLPDGSGNSMVSSGIAGGNLIDTRLGQMQEEDVRFVLRQPVQ